MSAQHGYNLLEAERISDLVNKHEVGGNEEANILQDADSISYFDNNLGRYLKKKGYEKTKAKVDWMFNRCSDRAKSQIINLPMYKQFLKEFEKNLKI